MAERLVAIPLDGVMRLYAVNGDGPVEVGRLDVGALDVHALAIIGAALSDLRGMVTGGQLSAPREAMPMRRALSTFPTRSLPKAPPSQRGLYQPGHRGAVPDPDSLNGRIREYLSAYGPSDVGSILAAVDAQPTSTKTARQRVSTGLATLKRAGTVKREGKGRYGVWSMR
jgi:hypothetical protein